MSTNTSPQVQPPKKRHRVSWYVFLVIQLIFLSWVAFSVSASPSPASASRWGCGP